MQPNLLALLDHPGGFDDGLVSVFAGSIRHDHWLYEQQPHGTHRDEQGQGASVTPGLFIHKYLGTSIRIQESTFVT